MRCPSGSDGPVLRSTRCDPHAVALLPDDYTASVDLDWIDPAGPGGAGVGRHGGLMFNFDSFTDRGSGSGYVLWWIDRVRAKLD